MDNSQTILRKKSHDVSGHMTQNTPDVWPHDWSGTSSPQPSCSSSFYYNPVSVRLPTHVPYPQTHVHPPTHVQRPMFPNARPLTHVQKPICFPAQCPQTHVHRPASTDPRPQTHVHRPTSTDPCSPARPTSSDFPTR